MGGFDLSVSRKCEVCVVVVCLPEVSPALTVGLLVAAVFAAMVALLLLPYNLREPVCLTAEYCPGRFEADVTLEAREALLALLCSAGAPTGRAAVAGSIEFLRLEP